MSLADGKVNSSGLTIGVWPRFPSNKRMPEDNDLKRLRAAVAKIRQQFMLAVRLPDRGAERCFFGRTPGETFTAGKEGAVIRVISGAGSIIVAGKSSGIEYGDWIYVPPGRAYQLKSRVVSGPGFGVVQANLVRA